MVQVSWTINDFLQSFCLVAFFRSWLLNLADFKDTLCWQSILDTVSSLGLLGEICKQLALWTFEAGGKIEIFSVYFLWLNHKVLSFNITKNWAESNVTAHYFMGLLTCYIWNRGGFQVVAKEAGAAQSRLYSFIVWEVLTSAACFEQGKGKLEELQWRTGFWKLWFYVWDGGKGSKTNKFWWLYLNVCFYLTLAVNMCLPFWSLQMCWNRRKGLETSVWAVSCQAFHGFFISFSWAWMTRIISGNTGKAQQHCDTEQVELQYGSR